MKHTVHSNSDTPLNTIDIEPYTRARAIKLHCTECLGFEEHPRDCTSKNCALYPFRGRSTLAYVKKGSAAPVCDKDKESR